VTDAFAGEMDITRETVRGALVVLNAQMGKLGEKERVRNARVDLGKGAYK
jgi:hypothetical protein